jgi:hypothetical protein
VLLIMCVLRIDVTLLLFDVMESNFTCHDGCSSHIHGISV